MQLTVDYLANHPEAIPQLARWSFDEWRRYIEYRGRSFDDVVAGYRQRVNTDALPLAVVAIADNDAVIGTGALMDADLPLRPDLTPWLASIFVAPEHRGRGVASMIVERLVNEATRLDRKRLYLWTSSAAPLYARLGWQEIEKLEYCGSESSVMLRELAAPALDR